MGNTTSSGKIAEVAIFSPEIEGKKATASFKTNLDSLQVSLGAQYQPGFSTNIFMQAPLLNKTEPMVGIGFNFRC